MTEQPYKKLFTYRFSVIIYDLTVEFCKRFLLSRLGNLSNLGGAPDRRTSDQMIQAARSGKQNIVEGSDSMKTSIKSAIKLTNVAKASQEELLADYEDFLRQRNFAIWPKADSRVVVFRRTAAKIVGNLSFLSTLRGQLTLPNNPEEAGNLLLTLCHQITYLLNKQVEALERKLIREGGYSERLYKMRREFRGF